jgi:hypothetical protein
VFSLNPDSKKISKDSDFANVVTLALGTFPVLSAMLLEQNYTGPGQKTLLPSPGYQDTWAALSYTTAQAATYSTSDTTQ